MDLDTDDIIDLQYDTFIIKYTDENASNFNHYHLPIPPVPPSTTTTVSATKYIIYFFMTDKID